MWAHIVRDRLGIDDPQCARMRFHVQTAGSTLTSREPENNVIRVTLQALAAVLGGTQSLHTNGMDEALSLPSESSARTALRTQQIIAHESGLADVADALGGAPVIEELTAAIEERAAKILEEIENMGGPLRAVEDGYQQALIEEEAYRELKAVESGERIVVGVNRYESAQEEPTTASQRIDPRWEERRIERLAAFRAQRSDSVVSRARRALEESARSDDNILVHLIEGAKSGLTIGEMSSALAAAFGEYRE
jgi:methylmalonyl-CoA mutase N-terminal domain/subunit